MMDIVERLSQWADNDMRAEDVALTAKHEIERLRKVMEIVADALYDKGDYECWAALRNALWQEVDLGQIT